MIGGGYKERGREGEAGLTQNVFVEAACEVCADQVFVVQSQPDYLPSEVEEVEMVRVDM